MKISKRTINVFENFYTISNAMKLLPGHTQVKKNETNTIFAKATVAEDFPSEFCIGDLQFFIRLLKLAKEPELEFRDGELIVREGLEGVENSHSLQEVVEKSIQRHIPENIDFQLENIAATFVIPEDAMAAVKKNAVALKYEKIELICRDGGVFIEAGGRRDRSLARRGGWSRRIGTFDVPFVFIFDVANWLFEPRSYTISVDEGVAAHFYTSDLEYFCVVEEGSWFKTPST